MPHTTEEVDTSTSTTPGPRRIILCFDGTGNSFQGNESDTNIVKIYQMLDRHKEGQFHYYQRELFLVYLVQIHMQLSGFGSGYRYLCQGSREQCNSLESLAQDQVNLYHNAGSDGWLLIPAAPPGRLPLYHALLPTR